MATTKKKRGIDTCHAGPFRVWVPHETGLSGTIALDRALDRMCPQSDSMVPQMTIPADTRKFGLKTLLTAITSIAVAFALQPYLSVHGFLAPLTACGFWVGMSLLVVSDVTDSGPIDSRGPISQALNLLGILAIILSIAACAVCLMLNAAYKWLA